MKKVLLSVLTLTAFALGVTAQNYYAVKASNYATPGYDYDQTFATANTTALEKTSNDLLSAEQTIPFTFNFYGNAYTKYKASDNGYITFNTAGTASEAPVIAPLPTAGGPNNAIYAFWHDFELKAAPNPNFFVKVVSYTTGTAPNRVHHIQYFGISRKGAAIAAASDIYVFAISLFEGAEGNFDITYRSGWGSTAPSGVMGCENSDGTSAKMINDALGTYRVSSTSTEDVVYRFISGTQVALDAAVVSTNVNSLYKNGTTVNIEADVSSLGSTEITSLDLNYSVGTGATQTTPITGISLKPSGDNTLTLKSTIPWTVGAAGTNEDVKVWVSNPNGSADENMANDAITTAVLSNNGTSTTRNVLLEEATGAWCQHCPDAHTYVDNLRSTHKERIIIAIHHNSDQMTNAESDKVNAAFSTGYPSGFINRKLHSGQDDVGLSRGLWNQITNTSMSEPTPVKINIKNVVYNDATRKLDFTIEAEFFDYYAGNLRIGAMIKEDEIRGNGTGYDQIISATYTSNSSHPYYEKKNPMVGYPHKDVIVAMPSGAWGTENSVPATVAPGDKITYDYSYTLPAMTNANIPTTAEFFPTGTQVSRNKPANHWIIGFISEYDANDNTKRSVLNANERQMWNTAASVTTADLAENTFTLVPNTANNHVEVALNYNNAAAKAAKVTITNLAGKVIGTYNMNDLKTGMNTLKINTTDFANGIYLVNISGTEMNLSQKLVIAH